MAKCDNCGANLPPNEARCPYCGGVNAAVAQETALDALLGGAYSAMQTGNYAAAIALCRKALARDPQLFDAYFYLANSLHMSRQTAEAIEALKPALQLRPQNPTAYYNIGTMALHIGRVNEARTYLEHALRLTDADPTLPNRAEVRQRIVADLNRTR